ncbi:hypothetical protein [Actinophytocola sp.]|uniref:hypothetical protein n=1 Tax=Actinophytocola sp. TaxID=1872138 RepID=UPI0038999A52
MGLFNRNRQPAEPTDEALPELTVSKAQRLRDLVRGSMAVAGYEVTVYAGHVEDADGRQFGLGGLARRLAAPRVPDKKWPTIVDDHVRRLLASVDGPDEFDVPTDDLLERTYLRLYEAGALPSGNWWTYGREALPGVLELLALDLPDSVATFNDEQVAKHGLDRLRTAGLANLRREEADERATHEGVEILVGSMFMASTVLVLREIVLRTTGEAHLPNGVLVAVPFRHQLLYHVPRDGGVVEALNTMAGNAAAGYDTEVGPISPHVYWWQDGHFQQITHRDSDGRIEVHLEGGFGEVFTRLFPGS